MHRICTIANFRPVRFQYKIWLLVLLLMNFGHSRNSQKNISIIEQLTAAVWDSLCTANLPDSAELIIDTENIKGEKKFFLNSVFLNSMNSSGWQVNTKTGRYKLVVSEFNAEIFYHENTGRLTGFSSSLERILKIKLKNRLEDIKTGRVITADNSIRLMRDDIDSGILEEIEQSSYSFSRGSQETYSRWSRYFEPGIALFSVSAMIYLLFSVRF